MNVRMLESSCSANSHLSFLSQTPRVWCDSPHRVKDLSCIFYVSLNLGLTAITALAIYLSGQSVPLWLAHQNVLPSRSQKSIMMWSFSKITSIRRENEYLTRLRWQPAVSTTRRLLVSSSLCKVPAKVKSSVASNLASLQLANSTLLFVLIWSHGAPYPMAKKQCGLVS